MTTLVLTVVGDDRVGLVAALADIVSSNGGNWERSHLAELAGVFAGVVVVTVPDRQAQQLQTALAPLDGLLEVSVRSAPSDSAPPDSAPPDSAPPDSAPPDPVLVGEPPRREVRLELLGNDRPGIVAALSGILARHGLGVADLQTATREAPMAGGLLFEASAIVTVGSAASLEDVRSDLEELATEIMVDLSLVDVG